MTLDLDAIEERANQATLGPWESLPNTGPYTTWIFGRSGTDGEGMGDYTDVLLIDNDECSVEPTDADARFMAAAREDVPALAAAIRRVDAVHHMVEELVNASIVARRCAADRERWPCTTQRAIQGIENPEEGTHG